MKIKRKPQVETEPEPLERDERQRTDALFCEWTGATHNPCHKLAQPGMPFCEYHSAAVFGMARRASYPDPDTRAKFDQVWEHYVDPDDDREVRP